jgi:hypothetical protein
MDRHRLETLLDQEGVRRDTYAFGEPERDEQSVLAPTRGGWIVYYWERGLKTGIHTFETEDEACRYLLNILLRDSTARHTN